MLDYKDIITKHYAPGMSGMAIAKSLEVSVSGVNDFLRAFKECKTLGYAACDIQQINKQRGRPRKTAEGEA